jgi:hypothetical protein
VWRQFRWPAISKLLHLAYHYELNSIKRPSIKQTQVVPITSRLIKENSGVSNQGHFWFWLDEVLRNCAKKFLNHKRLVSCRRKCDPSAL